MNATDADAPRIDELVETIRRSRARIIVLAAPPGYAKMQIVHAVAAASAAPSVTIDVTNCRSDADVATRLVTSLVLDDARTVLPPRTIAVTLFENRWADGNPHTRTIAPWIARLARSAQTTFVVARRTPVALLDALAAQPVLVLGAAELSVDLERERERLTMVSDAWMKRYVAAFGGWPKAWALLRLAATRPQQHLRKSDIRELAASMRGAIDALDVARRPAAVALAAFGRASSDEIAAAVTSTGPDVVDQSLRACEGFVVQEAPGVWRMVDFARQVFFDARAPADVALATSVVRSVAQTATYRALVMALEAQEIALVFELLAPMSPSARRSAIETAEAALGVGPFLIDDRLFLSWWDMPRSRQQLEDLAATLKAMRSFSSPDIRWRRNLAIALAQTESSHALRALDRLESLLALKNISEDLRPLAYARLAYGFAWAGDAERFSRLEPLLNPIFSDARRARLRYDYVRCLGDAVGRRSVLAAMDREAAGVPWREREVAISTALDAFFSADPARFDAVMASSRSALETEHERSTGSFGGDPHRIAFLSLVRAAATSDDAERAVLLRAAIANADSSWDIELRIATRLAMVYAFAEDASTLGAQAERLAQGTGSGGLLAAVAYAKRGEVDGPLVGLARRFGSDKQPSLRFRLGVFDGIVRGPDKAPIPLAERQLELLTFLGLHPDGWADREAIVEAIWPDLAAQAAVGALKTAAHRARSALGDPRAIVPFGSGYRLSPSVQLDVAALEQLIGETPGSAIEALGGLEASYAVFASGIERLGDRVNRWPWFDRYSVRIEAALQGLAALVSALAIGESKFDLAHRIAADLRSLDEADETAFKISIEAHRRAHNAIGERREIERYSALLRSFGADVDAELARLAPKHDKGRM